MEQQVIASLNEFNTYLSISTIPYDSNETPGRGECMLPTCCIVTGNTPSGSVIASHQKGVAAHVLPFAWRAHPMRVEL